MKWALVEGGRFPHNPESLSAKDYIEEIISLYKNVAQSKNIQLQFQADENTFMYCDPDAFSTVVKNLVDNAIKFTDKSGIINIRARRKNGQTIIKVQDSGKGIPVEKRSQLFNFSGQRGGSATDGKRGTGLGLVLCKELVEMNGYF